MTQMGVAQELGISQSALSKMESARLIPSAPQWFAFCEITSIPADSLTLGYLERNKPATVEHGAHESGFKLPKPFAEARGSKVRAVMPFLVFFRDTLGEEKLNQYLESLKLDPDFFVDLDNQISLNFCLEIMRTLVSKGELKGKDFGKMSGAVVSPGVHGGLFRSYASASDSLSRIKTVIGSARQYECNFRYKFEEQSSSRLVLSVQPEEHLEAFNYLNDPILGNAICRYKQHYFEKIGGDCGERGPGLKLKELDCHFKGADRCVYELRLAS